MALPQDSSAHPATPSHHCSPLRKQSLASTSQEFLDPQGVWEHLYLLSPPTPHRFPGQGPHC